MHAWDEPAEVLLASKRGAHLVMPRLGEPVEPAHVERVEPWWRGVDTVPTKLEPETIALPRMLPWPLD